MSFSGKIRRAALYLRVSTGRQAEGDVSLPSQREMTTRYCEAQGWVVSVEFVEPGASATDDRRPIFQQMLEEAASPNRRFDVVCVHAFSRFYRNGAEMELTIRKLKKFGVEVVSVTQPTGDDPSQAMMRQIIGIFDEYTSKENGKNVIRSMRESAKQGFWNGSPPPLGYRTYVAEQRGAKNKKKLEIDPAEAELVRLIFKLYSEGDGKSCPLGVKETTKWLNARGYRTRRGSPFGVGSLYNILTNPCYAKGVIPFGTKNHKTKEAHKPEDIVQIPVPTIINQDLFEQVQARLSKANPRITPPRFTNGPTLLAGLAVCASCGAGMVRTGTRRRHRVYIYYSCGNCGRSGKTVCKGQHIPMEKLNTIVLDGIKERLFNSERLTTILQGLQDKAAAQTATVDSRTQALKAELTATEEKLRRLYRSIEEGIVELDDILKERIEALKTQRQIAQASLDRIADQARTGTPITPELLEAFSTKLTEKLTQGDVQAQKAYLQAILDRIEVDDHAIRIVGNTHILAAAIKAGDPTKVSGFVRKWRTNHEQNH